MESSRAVDLSVLGRPSTQRGGQKMSRARHSPRVAPNRKIPSPSPPFIGLQPIYPELPQYAPTPPPFEVGSQTPAPQSRRADRERMDRAQTPVDEIGPFPWMQQSNMSTDGWMRSVSPPGTVEGATPDSTHGSEANNDYEHIPEVSTTKLYLGNLPLYATKQDIQYHLSTHGTGKITYIKLMNGFGFIEYEDVMDARDIVSAFHGSDFMGSRLTVNFARGPRHTESRLRGQARLVQEEGAREAGSPQQLSEQDRMPRDFEMQMQISREQQSRRHDLVFQQQQQQHLKMFAIKGNANPEQTPEMPPRFQKLRNHYEDGDFRNTGAENKTSGSWDKRSKTLKKPMPKDDLQPDILNSINDDAGSMSGKNTAMRAAALGSTGGNNTMFICYTISEDFTGSQENVTRQRLSTLGARCRKKKIQEFSHSLA